MGTVATERAALTSEGLTMRLREQWGARDAYNDVRRVDAPSEAFFLHIAVVNDPGDLLGTEDEVARAIERIGWARFPNTGFSYNGLVFNTGRLYEGQPLTRRGAHTYNDKTLRTCVRAGCPSQGRALPRGGESGLNLNYTARALCLPQMVDDPVTDIQVDQAARWAAAQIRSGLATKTARWHGHRCVSAKDCPGNKGFARLAEIQTLTDRYVATGLNPTVKVAKVTRWPGTWARTKPLLTSKFAGYRKQGSEILYVGVTTNRAGDKWLRTARGNYIHIDATDQK
jgi:hypothetical protein